MRVLFWIFLVIGALEAVNSIPLVLSANYYIQQSGRKGLCISAVLLIAAVLLRRREKKTRAAREEAARQRAEADRIEQEEKLRCREAWEAVHGTIKTKIAGVTFDNEDGTSRQRVLQGALADECCGSITLEHYERSGADAILVVYDGHGVGNIPQTRVAEVLAVMDRITAASLSVERFVPENEDEEVREVGGVIYRADLTLVYSK